MSSPRHEALRPQRQYQHHDEEGHHDGVGRDIDGAELLGEADDQRSEGRAKDRSHPADNDDYQRSEQKARVLAWRNRLKGAADNAGDPGQASAEREHDDKDDLDMHARGGKDVTIIDAGAYHHPEAR